MIWKKIALGLGVVVLSCGHEAPAPQTAHPARSYRELELRENPPPLDPATKLDANSVNADLDLLTYAIEGGYSGQKFIPKANWEQMTLRLSRLRDQPTTVENFCAAIGDALWQLPDAHLVAKRLSPLDRSSTKCGTLFREAKRPPSVGANYAANEKRAPWVASSVDMGRSTFGVISILRFAHRDDPAWGTFGAKIRELMKTDGIVIDLRGNPGGDDTRGVELAETLLDGKVFWGQVRQYRRTSPVALTLAMNLTYSSGRRPDGTLAPFMDNRYREAVKERDEAARSPGSEWQVKEEPAGKIVAGPKAFSGPIAILVDSGCGSSCESSLEVLREHPRAKVFGQRTGGYIHFGDIGNVALPNSHVLVQIATTYNEYPNGKLYDKIGFEPDVPVKDGSNAFDAAMAWMTDSIGLESSRKK